jgi:fatty acid kinase
MLDARALVRAMALYAQALEEFRDEIDSLNVFPVPDGDTGTNLLHTQRAVVEALAEGAAGHEDRPTDLAGIAATIAHAALTGARGNSGVILSQALRGFCGAIPGPGADGPSTVRALREAAAAARRAVAEPKEGTILTVLDESAAAAAGPETERGSGSDAGRPAGPPDAGDVLTAALAGARAALERTQSLLAELRAARVVDAGGKGAVLLLDALRAAVTGDALTEPLGPGGPVGHSADGRQASSLPLTYAYEVEFLLEGTETSELSDLRGALAHMGDSLAIVGGEALYRVHIHTDHPDAVLTSAGEVGTVRDASTISLEEQVTECLGRAARGVQAGAGASALIAVLEPSGVADAIRSLGAVIVETAGDDEGMVERMSEVLASTPRRSAVVLVEAAHAHLLAADPRSVELAVVVVSSLPEAVSAAAEFHPDAVPVANVKAMRAAAERCRIAELSAPEPSGDATAKAVIELVAELVIAVPDAEILTLVVGPGEDPEHVEAAATALGRRFPTFRLETLRGPGSSPAYQVGLE